MRKAVIVGAARTPVGKAKRGKLVNVRPEDLGAVVINDLFKRVKGLEKKEIDDIVVGCAFPEAETGMNFGRMLSFYVGFPVEVPGCTVNRFCSSGLETIAMASQRVMVGMYETVIAGGVEHMSMIPMGGNKIVPHPKLASDYPEAYTPMGNTAELVVERFGEEYRLTREALDEFGMNSQLKAARAQKEGYFKDQLVPVPYYDENGELKMHEEDEGVRSDTTMEGLAKLRPAFKQGGVVTAGNSSQMNDGAAFVVVTSEENAKARGWEILGEFVDYRVAGVPPEVMGVGPAYAIPKLLEATGHKKEDVDIWEVNEAFASQALYCLKKLDLPMDMVNVNGGAVALGHPLGCTGAKLTTQILYEMKRRDLKRGVVSMCIGGGMGAAGMFVRP